MVNLRMHRGGLILRPQIGVGGRANAHSGRGRAPHDIQGVGEDAPKRRRGSRTAHESKQLSAIDALVKPRQRPIRARALSVRKRPAGPRRGGVISPKSRSVREGNNTCGRLSDKGCLAALGHIGRAKPRQPALPEAPRLKGGGTRRGDQIQDAEADPQMLPTGTLPEPVARIRPGVTAVLTARGLAGCNADHVPPVRQTSRSPASSCLPLR